LRDAVENFLNTAAARIFPAAVLVIAAFACVWHLRQPLPDRGTPLALYVWEEDAASHGELPIVIERLSSQPSRASVETRLSTNAFWFGAHADAPAEGGDWLVEFPSRHAMDLRCWDRQTALPLGAADRDDSDGGHVKAVRGGFALAIPASEASTNLLCRSTFRGPAKISAQIWTAASLNAAQDLFQRVGSMIEVGLGVLAMSMALIATINRSRLYWAFVGWLFVSLRMALLSDGSDFSLFGMPLPAAMLTPMRQWTVCIYFVLTVTIFGLLFRQEMIDIGARWLLRLQQGTCAVLLLLCACLSFEQVLPVLWISSALLFAITLPHIYKTLRRPHSRPALWYASSIIVALVATLNEVVAAAVGQQMLMRGLNSVTAAIATALLASAAVAEHMRTDRRQREEAQRTLKAAYDDSPIGLFTVRDGETIVNANPAFTAMLGLPGNVDALPLAQVFGDEVVGEFLMLHAMAAPAALDMQARPLARPAAHDGFERWFAIKASTTDGRIFEGSLQDITERVRATSRLEFLVNHDPLTECLNLRGLSRQFERAQQPPKTLAYFDLDRFKLINDLYGHAAGDAVLKQVCERIRSQLGPQDLLARVGGDEFVVAFPRASIAEASQRCRNICALIAAAPFQIDLQRFALSVSGGLVAAEGFGGAALKEIVSAADTLCRMAKKRPNERLVVMEGGDTFFKNHKDELELIGCLERGETPEGLFLMMQPELSLAAPFDSLNFEVLLRMRKPNGDTVPAQVIIEAAEAHAKTAIIDRWVVATVIAWLEAHASQLHKTQFVGVNLSGSSLNDEAFVEELFKLFEYHRDAVSRICIEITETVALTDMVHMQRFIDRARDLGVKVALDDFGAGYSSFGYLKGLSVDALKLDGSLVRDAATNPSGMAILSALGGLVRSLGMKSIGEYAENLPVLKALVAAGVDYAQGYGISRPVLPERILAADSAADFIEDPEILAFVSQLQARDMHTIPMFPEHGNAALPEVLH
jgi:diguanylate cyclase (GGDEF)-like protein